MKQKTIKTPKTGKEARISISEESGDIFIKLISLFGMFGENKLSRFFTKVALWFSIFSLLSELKDKVQAKLRERNSVNCLNFIVNPGSGEEKALIAMGAIYAKRKHSSSFSLKAGEREKFTPSGSFVLEIEGKSVVCEKEEPSNSRDYYKVTLPIEVSEKFFDLFDEFYQASGEVTPGIYKWNGWYWTRVSRLPEKRTVCLPVGVFEEIVSSCLSFISYKNWYLEKGIPWRTGFLFYGIPGTGKTSTAICLARALGKSLYCLTSKNFYDKESFEKALESLPTGAVVLIEDIDCLFSSVGLKRSMSETEAFLGLGQTIQGLEQTSDDSEIISLSDFLNAIDGAASHADGRILVITTNHAEKLDEALMRPGRVDSKILFGHATEDQLLNLSKKILDDEGVRFFEKEFKNKEKKLTMAEAEHILIAEALKNKNT